MAANFKYKQVSAKLMEQTQKMPVGAKLPNRNRLAKELGVARTTLEHAISDLIASGVLESKDGSGTYVRQTNQRMAAQDRWADLPDLAQRGNKNTWALLVSTVVYDVYPHILRGVQDVGRKNGVNVIVCNTDNFVENQEDYLYQLARDGVEGVVIVPAIIGDTNPAVFSALAQKHMKIVSCFRPLPSFYTPGVYCNSFAAGFKGTSHLIEQGCKKIAFLSSPLYTGSYERYNGYLTALITHGFDASKALISFEDQFFYETNGIPAAEKLLEKHPDVDGIFAFNDRVAREAYKILEKMGKRAGKDVKVVGCDNTSICGELEPRLTSIAFPSYEAGAQAAQMLVAMLKEEEPVEMVSILDCELIRRAST